MRCARATTRVPTRGTAVACASSRPCSARRPSNATPRRPWGPNRAPRAAVRQARHPISNRRARTCSLASSQTSKQRTPRSDSSVNSSPRAIRSALRRDTLPGTLRTVRRPYRPSRRHSPFPPCARRSPPPAPSTGVARCGDPPQAGFASTPTSAKASIRAGWSSSRRSSTSPRRSPRATALGSGRGLPRFPSCRGICLTPR